jgi:hypothetical protein
MICRTTHLRPPGGRPADADLDMMIARGETCCATYWRALVTAAGGRDTRLLRGLLHLEQEALAVGRGARAPRPSFPPPDAGRAASTGPRGGSPEPGGAYPAPLALAPWRAYLAGEIEPSPPTRMPRPKPSALTGSADVDAMIERVSADVLALLADGVPRPKPAIVAALAGRHAEDEVELTLVRLTITGRVVEAGGKYALAADEP